MKRAAIALIAFASGQLCAALVAPRIDAGYGAGVTISNVPLQQLLDNAVISNAAILTPSPTPAPTQIPKEAISMENQ